MATFTNLLLVKYFAQKVHFNNKKKVLKTWLIKFPTLVECSNEGHGQIRALKSPELY